MKALDKVHVAALDWPWKAEDHGTHIILVSDTQFVNLAEHPDEAIEKIHPQAPAPISLREHCRQAAARGATKIRVAYDYFFGGSQRSLYPDTDGFQQALKKVHDVAQEYGLGLEPSIISPLELGVGYKAKTGEAGRWMHYREGLRDPQTGAYSVMLWQQTRWCNNKGPMPVKLMGVRAFAFSEQRIPNTPFFAVDPDAMVELPTPEIEAMPGTGVDTGLLAGATAELDAMYQATRVRVYGAGGPAELDRVLVVLLYETVEMDYFSPSSAAFMDELVQQYHDAGITLAGVYSDEMHIQQDWSYHSHFDNGQFTVRYASPGFERAFAERFGAQYRDFAKYMLFFACHQHDFLATHEPKLPSQHVFGSDLAAIQATLKFRRDYYTFLEGTVVDLARRALHKLEALNGHPMDAFYHATWAESPTCDAWAVGGVHNSWSPEEHQRQYEYTPDFIWSNTVQQASAACANYFKWNEFLTGGNNDTAEGGYADRDYFGRALACSLAALNRRPLGSAGMWGMPPAVRDRMIAVSAAFGVGGHPAFHSVADYQTREIEVLFVYPQDLVAVDERFGSWIVQYGYANSITAEKLAEYGTVTEDGQLVVKGRHYRALCVLYEPFPSEELLKLLKAFVQAGGTAIWSSTPPMQARVGELDCRQWMAEIFGAELLPTPDPLGLALPGRQVVFEGKLAAVPMQSVLTDFVTDRFFPVRPSAGSACVARVATGGPEGQHCVGTWKSHGTGQAIYLGFRPRDDQAATTGVEMRTWFEVLYALGCYPSSGAFADQDNPTVISRTTPYLATRFPNGALAISPHYCRHVENWPGGFYRDAEVDQQCLEANPVPSDAIALDAFPIAGQSVTYRGRHAVLWRTDAQGQLIAFAGLGCTGLALASPAWGSRSFVWSDAPVDIGWHPLGAEHATETHEPLLRVWCGGPAKVTIPLAADLTAEAIEVWHSAQEAGVHNPVGYVEGQVPFQLSPHALELEIDEGICRQWLYVARRKTGKN